MNTTTKVTFIIAILIFSPFVMSHDANITTFQIRHVGQEGWVYEIMTPLSNLDKSLKLSRGQTPHTPFSLQHKKAIVSHIKDGFHFYASGTNHDGKKIEMKRLSLGQGKIKLDQHISVLIFEIKGMPENISKLNFKITSMSLKTHGNNVLRAINGKQVSRHLLNHQNNFSGEITGIF